jgi:GTP-binding protein
MFVDRVKIFLKAGDGGNGMVAMRREKYVEYGGPDGGNGGHGGNIVFEVDEGLSTLIDLRYNKHIKSAKGENGQSKSKHGKNSKDTIVKVPPGTIVKDNETGKIVADLTDHGQQAVICKGGKGGKGNKHFKSNADSAPKYAEMGARGQEREVVCELKLLADVGLVGFPSVGKSTILATVTRAKPKIAAYHFTTIIPNLGVVGTAAGNEFVMADLPGLIEGASQGVGLGHQFLRHIERTRVILHVLDMSGSEGRDPLEDFNKINNELEAFNKTLLKRPQLIVANKMDLEGAKENLEIFKEQIGDKYPIFEVSAITNQGLREVMLKTYETLQETPYFNLYEDEDFEKNVVYKFDAEEQFEVVRGIDGTFEVRGPQVERIMQKTNFDHEDAAKRFARALRLMGVDEELRRRGCEDGETVRILDFEFEFRD